MAVKYAQDELNKCSRQELIRRSGSRIRNGLAGSPNAWMS